MDRPSSDQDTVHAPLFPSHISSSQHTSHAFLYFGLLTLFIYLATPAGLLIDIQTTFMLKNQLHATAPQISMFRLLTAIPIYFAFVFGLIRDQWNPFGLRDRGYFLIFGMLTAMVYIVLACSKISYSGLLAGLQLAMLMSRFVSAAYQGLMALVGQQRLMSGRLAVVWNVVASLPDRHRRICIGVHLCSSQSKSDFYPGRDVLCLHRTAGLVETPAVFTHTYDTPQARGSNFVEDVRHCSRHRAVYPAVLICFLWNFAPGANTPLQFYLTDVLHASDAVSRISMASFPRPSSRHSCFTGICANGCR